MKRLITALTLLLLFSQCNYSGNSIKGNDQRIERTTELGDFTSCTFSGEYEVTLVESRSSKVIIEADENLFDYITVDETGDKLHIDSKGNLKSDDGIKVELHFTDLEKIEWMGAGKLVSDGKIDFEDLTIYIAGAGQIDLDLEADDLEIRLSGAGDVKLTGEVEDLNVAISGAGNLNAYGLEAVVADITITGVGSADVYASEELDAQVSGLGNINYKGNPSKVSDNVSGLGKIANKSGD